MKKYLWMLPAAAVIGALRVNLFLEKILLLLAVVVVVQFRFFPVLF